MVSRKQMNCQTLSEFRRNYAKKFLSLMVLVLVILPGVLNSFGQEEQTIILTTSKNSYLPGDVVQLNGNVMNQPGQLVAIQIKDSSGNLILIRTMQSDKVGNFLLQFKIPTTATTGNFSIIASTKINGFVVMQTKTITATVPEFLFSIPVLLLSIMSMILFYRFYVA